MNEEENKVEVLSTSLKDYIEIMNLKIGSYGLVGIHYKVSGPALNEREGLPEGYLNKIPVGAEVVVEHIVNFQTSRTFVHVIYSGIALVPKPKSEQKSKKL